jgi:hypothetical protein
MTARTSRGYLHDQGEVLVVAARPADVLAERGQFLGPGKIDREQPVPSDRSSDGTATGPFRGDPDRDARALDRQRGELSAPQRVQPVEALVQDARPLARIDDLIKGGVTIGPSRMVSVTEAMALSATQGSATARPAGGQAMRSHRNRPSQPRATRPGRRGINHGCLRSPNGPNGSRS